jgi:hypothetical protein
MLVGVGQTESVRLGSRADVTIVQRPGAPLILEVETHPEITRHHEILAFMYPRSSMPSVGSVRRMMPPLEPGRYRLVVTLPDDGVWGFSLRYVTGMNIYYAYLEQPININSEEVLKHNPYFHRDLREGVPGFVQSVRSGVFGLLSVLVLSLIGVVLRTLRAKRDQPAGNRV